MARVARLQPALTARDFGRAHLTPSSPLSPEDVRLIRSRADMSQAVFAQVLGVSSGAVQSWEHGDRVPSGSARRLLALAATHGIARIL